MEKWPRAVEFLKFSTNYRTFHRNNDQRVVFKFRDIWPTGNWWNCALLTWQKTKISSGYPALATRQIAPKICQASPRQCTRKCSRFHPNRFTFGRVTAERVNTAKTRRNVNPIFGWSLASSRIKIQSSTCACVCVLCMTRISLCTFPIQLYLITITAAKC